MDKQERPSRAGRELLSWLKRGPTLTLVLVIAALLAAPFLLRWVDLGRAVESEIDVPRAEGEPLGIKQIVRQVKSELLAAEQEASAAGELALFEVDTFDLELNFVVQERASAKVSGAELVVVGKETEVSSQKVQKIHLRWKKNPDIEGELAVGYLKQPPPPREEQ